MRNPSSSSSNSRLGLEIRKEFCVDAGMGCKSSGDDAAISPIGKHNSLPLFGFRKTFDPSAIAPSGEDDVWHCDSLVKSFCDTDSKISKDREEDPGSTESSSLASHPVMSSKSAESSKPSSTVALKEASLAAAISASRFSRNISNLPNSPSLQLLSLRWISQARLHPDKSS